MIEFVLLCSEFTSETETQTDIQSLPPEHLDYQIKAWIGEEND